MTNIDKFTIDLNKFISYELKETPISYAEIIGVLTIKVNELATQANDLNQKDKHERLS